MQDTPTILLVGASRGLGHAMAAAFLAAGWRVIGTVRAGSEATLATLSEAHPGRVEVETLDITAPDQIAGLAGRLTGRSVDMLFVNAGVANERQDETIAETSTEAFVRVMVTNALGVMRTVEGLQDVVRPGGLIGAMSSGLASIANNTQAGGSEVYRGSKAALNQYMRSFAARTEGDRRPLVLMAPGWIRTDLGGADAPYGMDETIPVLVRTLIAQQGTPGLRFIDRFGNTVPW